MLSNNKKIRKLQYTSSIREGIISCMKKDKNVIALGLGIDDPKGLFGTTLKLKKIFGKNRVFDMPTAENSMTGITIGASLNGFKPILTHLRVEFSLLSFDQIINQAAKWNYMTAGKMNVPIVIRLIIGKGWGQGPQHSQSLESLFANIPGLKVVCPSNAYDAKGMIISSIIDRNPVIFFEHRWLHSTFGHVPKKFYKVPLGKSKLLKKGKDISIISSSLMTIECIEAAKILKKYKIEADILDLRSLRPLDKSSILKTAKKTKKILVVDNGWMQYGISSEILSLISENLAHKNKLILKRIGVEDTPIPSSRFLAKYCYPGVYKILKEVSKILKFDLKKITELQHYKLKSYEDVPDQKFVGPF